MDSGVAGPAGEGVRDGPDGGALLAAAPGQDQVQYTSGAITGRRTRSGGSGAVWPLGALTMGRRLRRTWSKKAGPVMPPSQIRTARAPVSRASRAAYRFHDAHEVVSSSRRTAVSWAWTSLVSSPAATA